MRAHIKILMILVIATKSPITVGCVKFLKPRVMSRILLSPSQGFPLGKTSEMIEVN